MELALRKQKILSAVVESYIATGEPVGSKALQSATDIGVSSATIRNELANLVSMGLLEQPHTSAGRIPSQKGYRYYIDNLMVKKPLDDRIKNYIEKHISMGADSPELILSKTALVLSQISDMAAITTTPPSEGARVHKIRFVSTGRHTSLAILITSNGIVKSKLFRCDFVVTSQLLEMFDKALNEKFAGIKLSEINRVFLQSVAASLGELSLFMPDVLIAIYDAVLQAAKTTVTINGETNLLFLDGYNLYSARNVLKFLSNTQDLSRLLTETTKNTKVYLGNESGRYELTDSSVIATRYNIADQTAGAVALIGPVRVDYKTLISEVEYASECVSKLIGELLDV